MTFAVIPEAAQRLSGIHIPGDMIEMQGLWSPGSRFQRAPA
jgi:hypothetical protein